MTDQEAFQYAGWIERARKAEAALTAHGFEVTIKGGPWVPKMAQGGLLAQGSAPPAKPNGYVYPGALGAGTTHMVEQQQAEAAADAATAIATGQMLSGFQGVAGALGFALGLPPIDYDTKS